MRLIDAWRIRRLEQRIREMTIDLTRLNNAVAKLTTDVAAIIASVDPNRDTAVQTAVNEAANTVETANAALEAATTPAAVPAAPTQVS